MWMAQGDGTEIIRSKLKDGETVELRFALGRTSTPMLAEGKKGEGERRRERNKVLFRFCDAHGSRAKIDRHLATGVTGAVSTKGERCRVSCSEIV